MPRGEHDADPRLRAARYRDGVEAEALEALAAQVFKNGDGARDHTEVEGGAGDDQEEPGPPVPSRRGGEAARLAATLDAVARTAVDRAIDQGAFDHLAYAGKPLPEIVASTDPDWWTASLLRREQVRPGDGLGPEALLLRVEDARMEETLDALPRETDVRAALVTFNHRIVEARRQLLGGPPVITPLRHVEAEVAAWHARRTERAAAAAAEAAHAKAAAAASETAPRSRRHWFRRH